MFIVKFTTGKMSGRTEIVHHAYAYAVDQPADCTKEPPMVSLALRPDDDVYDLQQTQNFVVNDAAYIMNEAGKTIQVVKNHAKQGTIGDPS